MDSKVKIAIAAVIAVVVVLATVGFASAAYASSRQSYPQATYGNYAPYGGEGSYSQAPYGYGYTGGMMSSHGSGGGMMGGWFRGMW